MNKPRLIDANELKDIITGDAQFLDWQAKEICKCIDCCDTAYDIQGVVEQLDRYKANSREVYEDAIISGELRLGIAARNQEAAFIKAIEIVKGQFTDADKMGGGAE